MPPVAVLMDALAATINSGECQTALGGGCPAHRGYQETADIKEQAQRSIWVSPDGWRPLGRCGNLRLEQHTLNVRIVRSQAKPENEPLDADVAVALALREYLDEFETDSIATGVKGRVEQIQGPLVIDRSRLTTGNQSSIGLVLDCDILRSDPGNDTETSCVLTNARKAVWKTIEGWSGLTGKLQRKYKTSDDFAELQLRDPFSSELPAIALYWGGIKPEWRVNRMQEWPLTMRASLWLPGDRHSQIERITEDIFDAIYRYKATGDTAPYLEKTLGFPPKRVDELTVQSVTLGRSQQTHALRADLAFTLRSNKDPFGDQ